MWKYDQSSGEMSHNGAVIAKGYSGKGKGRNNPAMEAVRATGPIPAGRWKIVGPPSGTVTVEPAPEKT